MSSHLRHCPKHRKPLPCAHCALVVKPAQTPPVEVVPPVRADATPVKRSQIPPDVRKKIEESLATAPRIVSEPTLAAVETSSGLKIVRESEATDIADDATSSIDRKRKSARLPAAPRKQTARPSYLKSVPQSVVTYQGANPDAPYGYDENNKPIQRGRSDQDIVRDLLGKEVVAVGGCVEGARCGHLMCRHCHPENILNTAENLQSPFRQSILRSQMKCKHGNNSEYCLLCARLPVALTFIYEALQHKYIIASNNTPLHNFDFFPEILGITRRQLIGLLERPVGVEPRPVKMRVLRSRSNIENQIAELTKVPARIDQLKQLIAESKDIVHGLGKKVMERRRAENPDDILDQPTRERYKREEKKKIEQYEQEKRELQQRLSHLDALKQRLANWGIQLEDYDVMTTTEDAVVTFEEKFELSRRYLEDHPDDSLESYVSFLADVELLKDSPKRFRSFTFIDKWRHFENEIVFQAIRWGLVRPTKDALIKYPRLRLGKTDEPEEIAQDDTENALILKTGGAQIGASIYNFGRTWAGRPRQSGSFDNTVTFGNKNGKESAGQFTPPGEFFPEVDSGDFGERYEE
jgi:hypothetical protein